MNFKIQDDIIRRALDFFGLRGVVPHDYEATVLPVSVIGNLEQPAIVRIVSGPLVSGTDLMIVPPGETWKPLLFAGLITQTAGTTSPRYRLNALQVAGYNFDLRATFASLTTSSTEVLAFSAGLNQQTRFYCDFGNDVLMPEGMSLQFIQTGGDGVIVASNQTFLMYRRLGERLVNLA